MAYKNKKKSPLKGADPTLVHWAYEAAGGELYQKYVQQHHDRMMSIVDEVRSWDFGTGAQRIIDANGKIPQSDLNAMRDRFSGPMRSQYIKGDNKAKEENMALIAKNAAEKDQWETIRRSFALNSQSKKLSNGFTRTDEGKELMEIILGEEKQRLVDKKCPDGQEDCDSKGSFGIMMTDWKVIKDLENKKRMVNREIRNLEKLYQQGAVYGDGSDLDALYDQLKQYQEVIDSKPKIWTSLDTVQNMIKLKDQNAVDMIESIRSTQYNKAKDLLPEDTANFNKKKIGQVFDDVILPSTDIMSVVYDPMFGRYSFYDNMTKHIMNHKYSDYGIREEELDDMGVFDDGQIDQKEAQHIADTFIGPPEEMANNEELQKELNNYFTQYFENNYNVGLDDRRASYLSKDTGKIQYNEDGTQDIVSKDMYTLGTDELGDTPEYTPPEDEDRDAENVDIINEEVEDVGQDDEDDDDEYTPQSINTDWA